jgi:hypothetical protein
MILFIASTLWDKKRINTLAYKCELLLVGLTLEDLISLISKNNSRFPTTCLLVVESTYQSSPLFSKEKTSNFLISKLLMAV